MTGSQFAGAMQGQRAGLVTRVVAGLVDLGILWLLGLLLLLSIGVARYLLLGTPFALPAPGWLVSTTLGALFAVAYLTSWWAATGRTPGKQVAGLRLISTSGAPLSAPASLLRAALCVAFPLGLLWILVSRTNASAQDLLVRSVVVYDWSQRPTRPRRPSPAGHGAPGDADDGASPQVRSTRSPRSAPSGG